MPEPNVEGSGEIRQFLASIFERYGHDLRGYAVNSVQRRVRAALGRSGLSSVAELERRSLADPLFFAQVLPSLTVRVSEMFRDPTFFLTLRTRIVPLLRSYPRLNIWHAGCATGEEAYSVAILLAEEGLYDHCQIYATDVSAQALEQAKLGVYAADSLETFASNYRAAGGRHDIRRYVTEAYGRISICEPLRRNVVFFQHDLVGDYVFGEMDAVFCRNVMIYFGRELQERVLGKLADSLRPHGFLCLGRSEQLGRRGRAQFTDFAPPDRIYRRAP
jgi:chemotaxis protein methyltransferase CheR